MVQHPPRKGHRQAATADRWALKQKFLSPLVSEVFPVELARAVFRERERLLCLCPSDEIRRRQAAPH